MHRIQYFSWRREWPAAAIIAVVLSALYWLSMPPGVTFEDSGLIAVACYNFGILHPPGYPLYSLLCPPFARLSDIVPLNPAQATALLSSAAAAGTCIFFYEIARRFGARTIVALMAALTLGFGARFWSQAIIPEVYTLNALLTAATFAVVLRILHAPSRRYWSLLFLLAGLGLANHWPLYAATAPAFALFLADGRRRRLPTVAAAAMFAAGLSPYLYLLLRPVFLGEIEIPSLVAPPQNFYESLSYISRELYTAKDALRISESGQCARSALWSLRLLAHEYTVAGAVIAVFGAAVFCRWRPWRWSLAILYGVASAPLLAAYLCFDIDQGTTKTTLAAYPLPAMLFMMIWITAALTHLRAPVNIVAAVVLAAAAGVVNWTENNRRDDNFGEYYAAAVLDSLPPNAALIIDSDWSFPLFYRRHALGERKDIIVGSAYEIRERAAERRLFSTEITGGTHFRDWGVIQEILSPDAAAHQPIPLPLIDFYQRLPEWRTAFNRDTREWDKTAVQRALFAAGRALTAAADTSGGELPYKTAAARAAVVQTPEGLFGQLDSRLRTGAATIAEIGDTLAALRQSENEFPPVWRAQLRHRQGILHWLAGQKQKAREQWQVALALDPDIENPALIDLLHLLAAANEWREYARLRQRFWLVKNPALRGTDAACIAAKICAAAETGANRLK